MRLAEQVKACLRTGHYSRALDLLRAADAPPDDPELAEMERLAEAGLQRGAEAQRLITASQELFAQQKSAEAIQSLRDAYELDRTNSVARSILANALVEHAISLVESDWWQTAKLAKQALELNPAHPTAKTIRDLIRERKQASSVDEWASQIDKLQSSGDLFAALSLVAEGLDVYPRNSKLLLIQDAIQRDQDARRRQARRGDMESLRHLEGEVADAADANSKKALAARIQTIAAKYWTDGEVLSVANGLLHRLGLVSQDASSPASHGQRAPVIFHVPTLGPPEGESPSRPGAVSESAPPVAGPASKISSASAPPNQASTPVVAQDDVRAVTEPQGATPRAAGSPAAEQSLPRTTDVATPTFLPELHAASSSKLFLVIGTVAAILLAAVVFFARKNRPAPAAQAPAGAEIAAPSVAASTASAPAITVTSAPAPAETTPEPSLANHAVADKTPKSALDDQPSQPVASPRAVPAAQSPGSLLVVAGQDNARVYVNGKLQPQLTQSGQLRLQNLEVNNYVVQVSKAGFQDPPQQTIHIGSGEQARLVFDLRLQPQPLRAASLAIQGGMPGTTVLIDQNPAGTISSDGALSVSSMNPGDHVIELRRERFKSRQFRKHFVAGETVSLAAADAALEAAPAELKINFTPADAKVAITKGETLTLVNNGVPLSLAAGTYTLTARTADGYRSSSALEIVAGQARTLVLSLAPGGMSNWDDPGSWKRDKDAYVRKGGGFVLYGAVPATGTFAFSAMPKGHLLQWVLNYIDARNYVLFQLDDNNFYRAVIHNGAKSDEIIVPHKGDKKSFRSLQIRVSPAEIVHQIKQGDSTIVLDRWTQPGTNLGQGKFGFYIPGDDQVTVFSFAHYAELNLR